jgi:hypothetical protein
VLLARRLSLELLPWCPAQVRRVPVSSLPKCYRVEYIELYELKP